MARNPYLRAKISVVELPLLTTSDQLLFVLKLYFSFLQNSLSFSDTFLKFYTHLKYVFKGFFTIWLSFAILFPKMAQFDTLFVFTPPPPPNFYILHQNLLSYS
jgi:hypothetical protein